MTDVNAIYNSSESIDFFILRYENVIGFLSLDDYVKVNTETDCKDYKVNDFRNSFQRLLPHQKTIRDIVVSNDQRFISVQIDAVSHYMYFKTSD